MRDEATATEHVQQPYSEKSFDIVQGPTVPDERTERAFRRLTQFSIVPILLGTLYFLCRLAGVLLASASAKCAQAIVLVAFLCIELSFAALPMFMSLLYWTNRHDYRSRSRLRIRGSNVPRVDVLLPCCGEDIRIIKDTIKAAADLAYPKDQLRLIVLDDGNSKALKRKVEQLGRRLDPLEIHYAARGEYVRFHSKAANLQYGLEFIRDLATGPAPFFAVLDIDMIPERQWLRASIPLLLQDDRLALVNTPQRWYNIPNDFTIADRCIHNQDLGEHMLDVSGNANCVGTGFVARRAAFDQIGGYPHRPMEDDTVVPSYILKAHDWTIAQLPESMQHGVQVVRYNDIVKQAAKWMMGHLATVGVAFGPDMRRATLKRKLGMVFTVYNWGLSRMCTFAAIAVLPAVVCSGLNVVGPEFPTQIATTLALAWAWQISLYIQGWIERQASEHRLPIENDRRLWVLPYEGRGALQLISIKLFGHNKWTAFRSTGAEARLGGDPLQNAFPQRLWHVFWTDSAYVHAVYFAALGFGVYKSIKASNLLEASAMAGFAYPPLVKVAYECLQQATVPFQYAAFAKPLEAREAYLARDENSKVVRPLPESKERPKVTMRESYSMPILTLCYYAFAFAVVCVA